MYTLHRSAFDARIVPYRQYDARRIFANPTLHIARLIEIGGLVGPAAGQGPAIACVDERTGQMTLTLDCHRVRAGNLLGLFFPPGEWCDVLALDERGCITVTLEGAFDYHASMRLESALGGRRTDAEQAMTTGEPLRATPAELVAFLIGLLDDTARFVARAATTDLVRLRRMAKPHTRLKAIHLVEPTPYQTNATVDLARLLAGTGTGRAIPIL